MIKKIKVGLYKGMWYVVIFRYLNRNQCFIQTSETGNFTKAIENQCFTFHNTFHNIYSLPA